ncbi:BatA domain-containing protein [Spongiimicrobium sp. 3-5]|uniref:BatA domain-containing protein n=1 Tax=Spongiimicrobium sp. 3-5 TaxID=3332596 RepID=UPI0039806B9F
MQFKYPELLWALFLLLIPIIIHLFQLRRFKKTPFTNVKMLQKVIAQSRKSSRLKKWLLLATRLLMLAAFVMAFARPFFAEKSALKTRETVIFLDNSFSMQAKTDNGTLRDAAIQELLKRIPRDYNFSLFTNEQVFRNVSIKDIQNDLLTLPYTSKQLGLREVELKAATFFSDSKTNIKDFIVISDFQSNMVSYSQDTISPFQRHLVQLSTDKLQNIAIDTAYVNTVFGENVELTAVLSSNTDSETMAVSLFNNDKLIAKTAADFANGKKAAVVFSLPGNSVINGKIEISDDGLTYDNLFFFNINNKEKIKVLSIGEGASDYLNRIFEKEQFQFASFSLSDLNYSLLETQNLIILNEPKSIPNALVMALRSFYSNDGTLAIIPSTEADISAYNALVAGLGTVFTDRSDIEQNITDIVFDHPLYQNVFEKKVTNFQYPKVNSYYKINTRAPHILSFQDNRPFLIGNRNLYIFTSSIGEANSNFKNSPLIVPTFYNMGINSLQMPKLYNLLGTTINVDIPTSLSKDNILKVAGYGGEFIPQQRSLPNKVILTFFENPETSGIYSIKDNDSIIKNLSFNYSTEESKLNYLDINNLSASSKQGSIADLFETIEKDSSLTELWKWFVTLAILLMLVEMLIQKYYK